MERGQMTTGLFLLVHDEFTGVPRIGPDLVRCGLVGAQLADLVIAGRLTMTGDGVTVARHDVSGLDDIGKLMLDGVAGDPDTRTVGGWTALLGDELVRRAVERLVTDGILRAETHRGVLGRRRRRYPAVDLVRARRPGVQLREMFADPCRFTLPGAFLASVLTALDADAVLEPGIARTRVRSIAGQATGHLPGSLSQLRHGVEGAAAEASRRRP